MDYPKDDDGNATIAWKEFIASKLIVFSSLVVSTTTFILWLSAMFSPLWQVYNTETINNKNYQLQLGLLWYQVAETNYNITNPVKLLGPFSYDTTANIADKLAKESYSIAGGTTFGFMTIASFGQLLSMLASTFSLIGFGPQALPSAFAYTNWFFSIISSWLSLLFVSLYPLMRKAPAGLYVPITSKANEWFLVSVPRMQVDVSWIIAFVSSIVSSMIQCLIMSIPISVMAYKKIKENE